MAKPLRLPNASEQALLNELTLRLIEPSEKPRWDQLVIEHHYLKNAVLVGEQLHYVAQYREQWLALLGWSAPAFHLKGREAWIGWPLKELRRRRHFLAQNSRFVLLGDRLQFPNLATRALGLCCQRLSQDWLEQHGHPIVAVESFVDSQLFRGTAYKAAGWTLLGPTSGFGRCAEDFYQRHDRPKQLWVRALDPQGTAQLKAEQLPPALAQYERPLAVRCPVPAGQLPSLLERLPQVPSRAKPGVATSLGWRFWASSVWLNWPGCPAPRTMWRLSPSDSLRPSAVSWAVGAIPKPDGARFPVAARSFAHSK